MKFFQAVFVVILCWTGGAVASAEDLAAAKIRKGMSAQTYVDEQGIQRGYVLFVPYQWEPGQRLPLIVYLNGKGENGEDGVLQLSNNFGRQVWEMQEYFPFLVVAPQCGSTGTWSPESPDTQRAFQVVDRVMNEFGADADRVFLAGTSAGGSGVWDLGSAYPERFAALIAVCGTGGDLDRLKEARMPVWNFINDGDSAGLVTSCRTLQFGLIQRGLSPHFVEFHKSGHNCWHDSFIRTSLYAWLLQQSRAQNSTAQLFDYLPPHRLLKEWTAEGEVNWGAKGDLGIELSEGNPGVSGRLIANKSHVEGDFHCEVWIGEGEGCEIQLIPDSPTLSREHQAGTIRLSLIPPDIGSGGVFHGADFLMGFEPAAEQSLDRLGWNDIRIQIRNGELKMGINGWQAGTLRLPTLEPTASLSGWKYAVSSSTGPVANRWRYFRVRDHGRSHTHGEAAP